MTGSTRSRGGPLREPSLTYLIYVGDQGVACTDDHALADLALVQLRQCHPGEVVRWRYAPVVDAHRHHAVRLYHRDDLRVCDLWVVTIDRQIQGITWECRGQTLRGLVGERGACDEGVAWGRAAHKTLAETLARRAIRAYVPPEAEATFSLEELFTDCNWKLWPPLGALFSFRRGNLTPGVQGGQTVFVSAGL
ncbi:hypothetical protein [Deinococcus sp. Leaf326]|uniref:hypothetical protein n=1 Tax=Deinococcus sp. Leaf326 TaxID=1736338 RepID=UPI0007007CF1|nr:hypothetical protein [Deinococcus sp. Leaf326]KQR25579.1 hypothetical protein ASF71_19035 [Deinococcus sp. Leaf326]